MTFTTCDYITDRWIASYQEIFYSRSHSSGRQVGQPWRRGL